MGNVFSLDANIFVVTGKVSVFYFVFFCCGFLLTTRMVALVLYYSFSKYLPGIYHVTALYQRLGI